MAGDSDKTKIFQAVASYTLENDVAREMPLVDYRTVIADLEAGRHAQFFMADIGEYLAGEQMGEADQAVKLLQGNHGDQFRLSIIKAKDGGDTIYIPLCEDMGTGRLLAVVPAMPDALSATSKVQYIATGFSDVPALIDDFISDGMKNRVAQGTKFEGSVRSSCEELVRATCFIAELPGIVEEIDMARKGQPPEMVKIVPARTTLGICFQEVAAGRADVVACMLARPAFDYEQSRNDVMQGMATDIKVGKPFSFRKA